MGPTPRSTARLTDPRSLRALAHPVRLELLGRLRADGPATATMLNELVDEAIGSVSYHLRQLADHGFIHEAPELAKDGRERWWRASHEWTAWSATDFLDSPERRAAANAFRKEVLNLYVAQLEEYLADEPAWGLEWVDASESSDLLLRLTPPELKALNREVFEVLLKWEARTAAQEHEGREQVQFIFHSFPRRGRLR